MRRSSPSPSCPGPTPRATRLRPTAGSRTAARPGRSTTAPPSSRATSPTTSATLATRSSLKLPSGSSAKSAAMCVGIEHPTLRLFARNTGSPLSALKVEVHFEDCAGRRPLPADRHRWRRRELAADPADGDRGKPACAPSRRAHAGRVRVHARRFGRQLADRRRLRRSVSPLVSRTSPKQNPNRNGTFPSGVGPFHADGGHCSGSHSEPPYGTSVEPPLPFFGSASFAPISSSDGGHPNPARGRMTREIPQRPQSHLRSGAASRGHPRDGTLGARRAARTR